MYEDSVRGQQGASSDQLIGQNISVPEKDPMLLIPELFIIMTGALHEVVECCSLTRYSGHGGGCDDPQCRHYTQFLFFCSGQEQSQGQLTATNSSAASDATQPG